MNNAEIDLAVGKIVYPINGKELICGSGQYACAVVASIDPFIIISIYGDMLWSTTVAPHEFSLGGKADTKILKAVMKRFYQDYPQLKPPLWVRLKTKLKLKIF